MVQARSTVWTDAGGAQGILLIRTLLGGSAIRLAVQGASNADYLQTWEGPVTVNGAPAPVAAQYLPLKPAALLYYNCADGTLAELRIPSPQLGIFLADQETIDAAAAAIVALNAVTIGNLCNPAGSATVSFAGGRLESLRKR